MPRFTVDNFGDSGVRLVSSPTSYNGSDLKLAQNVIINRNRVLGGLIKRPGLRPITDLAEGTTGRAIHGIIPVPLTDTQEVPIRTYDPYDDSISVPNNYVAWSDDLREIYALRLADASDVQVYLASNNYTSSTPPSLHVSRGATSIPVFTVRDIRGSSTYPRFISCVRAFSSKGPTEIYLGTATFYDNNSYLRVYRYNTSSGLVSQVGEERAYFNRKVIVSDIVLRDDHTIAIISDRQGSHSAISSGGDGGSWRNAFSIPNHLNPLSAVNSIETGKTFVGCSNSLDTDEPAAILEVDSSGLTSNLVTAPDDGDFTAYVGLTLYNGILYAARYRTTPQYSISIGRVFNGQWQEEVAVRGPDQNGNLNELWGRAMYVGQGEVINNELYYVLPNSSSTGAIIRKADGEWGVYGRNRAYRGSILGILDE